MLPWFVLSGGILVTMMVSIIRVNTRQPAQYSAFFTLLATLVTVTGQLSFEPATYFSGMFEASALSRAVLALFCILGMVFIAGTSRYLTQEKIHISDYYHLLLILILGASVLSGAKDFISMFIALEVMSLPAYTLVGFRRNDPRSNEAGVKYFIMGGAIGAVFLLGAAFIFGATGTIQLGQIFEWSKSFQGDFGLFAIGHLLVMIAFLFKVAAVPFHFWKPDVYEGAPSAVTGVMATIVSAASFVTLSRLLPMVDFSRIEWAPYLEQLKQGFRILAVLSLVAGSAVLLTQSNIKRMLAYSSIAHTGYLLLGLLSFLSNPENIYAVWVYLFGYSVMTAGIFVLLSLSERAADAGVELVDLTGLMKRNPFLTVLWAIFLFSMAGIPLTVGFFSKYFVFMGAVSSGEAFYVVVAALCAVVSAYAYLRPIALMVMRDADPSAATFSHHWLSQSVALVSALAVIYFGVMPGNVVQFLKGVPIGH